MKKGLMTLFIMIAFAGLAACSSDNSPGDDTELEMMSEPVTVKVMFTGALQEVYEKYAEPVLKTIHPHITVDYIESLPLPELIAANSVPDIFMPNGDLTQTIDLELNTDLMPMIHKYNYDLNRIDSALIDSIKIYSDADELYALPASKGAIVLMYNKDIFDKFAVSYPGDGMSWDETLALAKELTRVDEGIQYKGINPEGRGHPISQLELDYEGAHLTSEGWMKVARLWHRMFVEIPGNFWLEGARAAFTSTRDTAMILSNSSFLIRNPVDGLNWDMVQGPTFENKLQSNGLGTMFVISATSKVPDAAFQVIQTYHTDEVQISLTRDAALITELVDPDIHKQYGANIPSTEGKNIMANFLGTQAVKVKMTHAQIINPIVVEALAQIASGEKDVNTAMREAEERARLAVAEYEASK